ncbi:hypothetical protein AB3X91_16060 [Paraburkholderia sp. BR14263]|uniref:hypothetical protein n=1 Tax=unclassified Paraburkholderia TaxID=2615204 RepID=UPI0034CD66FC
MTTTIRLEVDATLVNATIRRWAQRLNDASRCRARWPLFVAVDACADAEREMSARNLMKVRALPCESE